MGTVDRCGRLPSLRYTDRNVTVLLVFEDRSTLDSFKPHVIVFSHSNVSFYPIQKSFHLVPLSKKFLFHPNLFMSPNIKESAHNLRVISEGLKTSGIMIMLPTVKANG